MKRECLTVLFAITVLLLTGCSERGMSGKDLYDALSIHHVPEDRRSSEEIIRFKRATKIAEVVFYSEGYIYVNGESDDPRIVNIKNNCPDMWKAHSGGPYVYLLKELDKNGFSFSDRWFTSAEQLASKKFAKIWPLCRQERIKAGIPPVSSEDY